jgi:hypothetical protein
MQGECCEMTEAEIAVRGVCKLRIAKDCWQLPEARKRQRRVFPWSTHKEPDAVDALILDF